MRGGGGNGALVDLIEADELPLRRAVIVDVEGGSFAVGTTCAAALGVVALGFSKPCVLHMMQCMQTCLAYAHVVAGDDGDGVVMVAHGVNVVRLGIVLVIAEVALAVQRVAVDIGIDVRACNLNSTPTVGRRSSVLGINACTNGVRTVIARGYRVQGIIIAVVVTVAAGADLYIIGGKVAGVTVVAHLIPTV